MRGAGVHVVGQKLSRVNVYRAQVGLRLMDVILDGTHQVSFAQTALTVDEQGIQRTAARGFGNAHCHRVSHSV